MKRNNSACKLAAVEPKKRALKQACNVFLILNQNPFNGDKESKYYLFKLLAIDEKELEMLDKEIKCGTDWTNFARLLADVIAPCDSEGEDDDSIDNDGKEWSYIEAVIEKAAFWKETISHFDSKTLSKHLRDNRVHRIWIVAATSDLCSKVFL